MTRISLSQPLNFHQLPLSKKRKNCYLNEFPISRDAFLKLKKSKKKNHQRQAKIVEIVNYFIQKGKGLCYTRNEKWIKLLEKQGFRCCSSTIDKDLAKLKKMNLIHINSWNKPQRCNGGSIRHIITPWNITQYEKNYIESLNKKGKGKPDETKKAFYVYKEKIMRLNFPATHNVPNFPARPKITRRSDRINTPYINIPPIIPLQGDGIAQLSQKRVRKRRRPPKIKKTYEQIDENQLKTHYDMSSAIEKMCLQPQFSGKEQQLKENFRRAYNLTHDQPMQWQKTPLHLAAHATIHGYDLKYGEKRGETIQSKPADYYYNLYPCLKFGDYSYEPEPLNKEMASKCRSLLHEVRSRFGDQIKEAGYAIGEYNIEKSDLMNVVKIKYDNPYIFSGIRDSCRLHNLDALLQFLSDKLFKPQ